MDPIANIRRQRELCERLTALQNGADGYEGEVATLAYELAEYASALDEWRTMGGFDPYTGPTDGLREDVKAALEGDSNDAEHDALVMVAEHFGVNYDEGGV